MNFNASILAAARLIIWELIVAFWVTTSHNGKELP